MSRNRMMLLAPLVLLAACAGQPAAQEAKAGDDPHCLKETGSKIEREGCAGHGRTVSREELERSGEIQTGDALKRIIP